MIFEKIIAIIADHTGEDIADISAETTFESLGVDSLDTVEMVMKLEEALNTELEVSEKFETVGDLVKYVESKLTSEVKE